jgi:hypothetical protein
LKRGYCFSRAELPAGKVFLRTKTAEKTVAFEKKPYLCPSFYTSIIKQINKHSKEANEEA